MFFLAAASLASGALGAGRPLFLNHELQNHKLYVCAPGRFSVAGYQLSFSLIPVESRPGNQSYKLVNEMRDCDRCNCNDIGLR